MVIGYDNRPGLVTYGNPESLVVSRNNLDKHLVGIIEWLAKPRAEYVQLIKEAL